MQASQAAQLTVNITDSQGISDIILTYPVQGYVQEHFIFVAGLNADDDNVITVSFLFED